MRYLAVVAVLFLGLALPARADSHLEGVARAGMVVGTKIENFDAIARVFKIPQSAGVGLAKEVVIEQEGGGQLKALDVRRVPGSGQFDIVFTAAPLVHYSRRYDDEHKQQAKILKGMAHRPYFRCGNIARRSSLRRGHDPPHV